MYISESDKTLIRQLIEKQLQAFQENDLETAFALTSPTIQGQFAPSDFLRMVRGKYAALIKPRSMIFRGFTLVNNFPALVSMIMDQEGAISQGLFIVQHQQDYSWRIHGYKVASINHKII